MAQLYTTPPRAWNSAVSCRRQGTQLVKHAYNAAFEWCVSTARLLHAHRARHDTLAAAYYCGYVAPWRRGEAVGIPQDKRKLGVGMS
jgi:DNA polymerase